MFPSDEAPYYRKGMYISAAFCLLVAVLSGVLSCWLIWENRQMAKDGVPEEYEQTAVDSRTGRPARHKFVW